ncbi:MAG: XdhC family protein [Alphaproteobacteria bacterium]|nr:XdhC family protein [Alphaproteobacteria bacterium]
MDLSLLSRLNEERAHRRAAVLVTDLQTHTQRLVFESEIARDPLSALLSDALRMGKSGVVETEGHKVFLTVQAPVLRIIAIGAVHISQALVPMAKQLGHDVIIVDPREAFASPERFPDVAVHAEWPDLVLPKLGADRYTAFLMLTHDPKIDDAALNFALKSHAFYIGALGSRKTHGKRIERLQALGFDEQAIKRIQAPIGLNIGAISPAEIALSILGEITAKLRLKPDGAKIGN